jgi:hypothetical protein
MWLGSRCGTQKLEILPTTHRYVYMMRASRLRDTHPTCSDRYEQQHTRTHTARADDTTCHRHPTARPHQQRSRLCAVRPSARPGDNNTAMQPPSQLPAQRVGRVNTNHHSPSKSCASCAFGHSRHHSGGRRTGRTRVPMRSSRANAAASNRVGRSAMLDADGT